MRVDHAAIRTLVNANRKPDAGPWEWPDEARLRFVPFDDQQDGRWQPAFARVGADGLRMVQIGPRFDDRAECEKFAKMLMGFGINPPALLVYDHAKGLGFDMESGASFRVSAAATESEREGAPDGILEIDLDPCCGDSGDCSRPCEAKP